MLSRLVILLLLTAPLAARAAPSATLTLEIRHLWKGQVIEVPAADLPLAVGEHLELTRLSYLLSNPRIAAVAENGRTEWLARENWQAFVDAADGLARVSLAGLGKGRYSTIQFHVGLDGATNTSDPNQYPPKHPLNPANNLHWGWQGGYIFLAAEGRLHTRENEDPLGFSYHLGNDHNLATVTLPLHLDLSERDATAIIDFHLDRLLDTDFRAQSSTHGREGDEGAARLVSNLENAFTLRQLRYPAPAPPAEPADPAPAADLVGTPYAFKMPKSFPIPALPLDYPLTEERVRLGEKLFHDTLLSSDRTVSCASCHDSAYAFTDGRPVSLGVDEASGRRNAMPLFNLAWKNSFFWDGRAPSLRDQALIPIEDANEMHESLAHVEEKLASHPGYPALFAAAFGDEAITAERLGVAIEQFVLTLTSFHSRFDRAMAGADKLTDQEKRGFELFFTEYDPRRGQLGADCFHCHGGANFTDHGFHNNGVAFGDDRGLEEITGLSRDRGRFSTPSLRNVALTAPYMHDGRFASLEEVLDHYTGGLERSPTLDPNLAKHPGNGIPLSEEDKSALLAFLRSLSDERYQ